ncbi:hypothetical protein [Apibacter sp.]|uniref:hypothetical protein n=1 Tax=Apibacter sp. TaxID=2023709 RepID=UPI0025EA168F|nr:hypothetical protein [Apibacter sp.]MCT6869241.1 hypothetical protein [Apibacter sp.]
MELILQLLMVLIVINSMVKLSFWKIGQIGIMIVMYAAFILLIYPLAIKQSKTQIEDFLANMVMMQNMSVLITVESTICFAFCFAALKELFGKKKSKLVMIVLKYYPGLLLFLVIFYGLTQSIFTFTGRSFFTIAFLYAFFFLLLIIMGILFIKKVIPEIDIRLEVHFIVSLLICILGLITTVDGKIVYKTSEESINLKYIFLSIGLFLIFFIVGFLGNRIKWKLKKIK